MAQRSIDLPAIEAEIERIRSFGLDALRARWRSMFGAMPPMALTKDLIARMMTYRIQEEAFGGLDRSTRKLLDGMAQGEKPGTDVRRACAEQGRGSNFGSKFRHWGHARVSDGHCGGLRHVPDASSYHCGDGRCFRQLLD